MILWDDESWLYQWPGTEHWPSPGDGGRKEPKRSLDGDSEHLLDVDLSLDILSRCPSHDQSRSLLVNRFFKHTNPSCSSIRQREVPSPQTLPSPHQVESLTVPTTRDTTLRVNGNVLA